MTLSKTCLLAVLCVVMCSAPLYAVDQSDCREDSEVFLYDNGALRYCTLQDDYSVNGITCQGDYPISLYYTGELESCHLLEEAQVDSQTCRGGDGISFYPDGHLKACVKPAD